MATTTVMDTARRTRRRLSKLPLDAGAPRRTFSPRVGLRGVLTALAGILAIAVSLQVSIAGVFASTRPVLALQAVPADAKARARLAEQLATTSADEQGRLVRGLALEALRRDLTQAAAIRALATAVGPGPAGEQQALALMLQAQRVSKRDVATQLWMVDHHRRRGDAAAVVRHLDLALRSSERARPDIFPLLNAASADPPTEALLLEALAQRPHWAPAFALFAVRNGTNLEFSARVARLLLDPRKPVDKAQFFMLIQRLSDVGNHRLAWSLYTDPILQLGGTDQATLRNRGFEQPEDTSRFDWSYTEQPDLWSAKERLAGRGTVLRVGASNGRSGEAARQIIRLEPGRHKLSARMGDVSATVFKRPEIRLQCAPGGEGSVALLRLRPDDAARARQAVAGSFVVPTDCRFQLISIHIAGDGAQDGPGAWIDDIVLR